MQILIVNVHSALNLGDDGIMRSTLALLKQVYPDASVTVAANDPLSWRKYSEITVISSICNWAADCRLGQFRQGAWRAPIYLLGLLLSALFYRILRRELIWGTVEQRNLLRAYYQADLVLSAGGGNFYAHRPVSPAFFWALIALGLGLALGKRVIMLPQSIGPIDGRVQRLLARAILGRVSTMLLREHLSEQFVRRTLQLTKVKVDVLPDMAFALADAPADSEIFKTSGQQLNLGISIIDRQAQDPTFQNQQAYEQAILSLVTWWTGEIRGRVYLIAQCQGPSTDQDDRIIASRIWDSLAPNVQDAVVLCLFDDALAVKAAYKAMDVVVATRMHAAIFALSSETPVVVVGYQPKSLGMIRSFELEEFYCHIDNVSSERLVELVQRVVNNAGNIRRNIRRHYEALMVESGTVLDYLQG